MIDSAANATTTGVTNTTPFTNTDARAAEIMEAAFAKVSDQTSAPKRV
jgi:hypothetical protein